jgi:hypothetical protein
MVSGTMMPALLMTTLSSGCLSAISAANVLTAGDDDLVAELVKSLGKRLADAGATAGDEDRIAVHFHDFRLCCLREGKISYLSLSVRRHPKDLYAPKGE